MNAILTTFGNALPRYRREVDCNIDPEVFVQLEAQAAARGLDSGIVFAVLEIGSESYEAQAEALSVGIFE